MRLNVKTTIELSVNTPYYEAVNGIYHEQENTRKYQPQLKAENGATAAPKMGFRGRLFSSQRELCSSSASNRIPHSAASECNHRALKG